MGSLAMESGFSKDLFEAFSKLLAGIPGGIGMGVVMACAVFAACSGSSVATAATIGSISLPDMRELGYKPSLRTGLVAAGGTLGILISPSTIFIVYGFLTDTSIGKLFMAGVVPGLILTALYLVTVFVLVRFSSSYRPSKEKMSWSGRIRLLYKVWGVLTVVVIVVGGIYLGFFTATEAGAIGVASMAVLAIVTRRVSVKGWTNSLLEAGKITSMIFAIVVGATIFGYFLTLSQFPFKLAKMIGGLEVSPLIVVMAIMITYLILGCFLDVLAMILLTVPIFIPIVDSLGIDFIWFGVLICIICEAALITPPIGMNCYVISGIAEDVALERIFLGVFPFLAMMVLTLALVIVFPQLALFLPSRMF
jgi:tripartite ATP-independent transporter DctM subunit